MAEKYETESRKLLRRLRDTMAEESAGQTRLDQITGLITDSIHSDVCSIYLFRDAETLELCATDGLNQDAVHKTRLRIGEGLVGRVARNATPVNTANAPQAEGFRFMPETGEEIFSSFLGIPIQRLGETLGVLVVQSKDARQFTEDEVYALEVAAMVIAEMTELGAFVGEGAALSALHQRPATFKAGIGQEGLAQGRVYLHEPRVVVTNPVADNPKAEKKRLHKAVKKLRLTVDDMLSAAQGGDKEQTEVLETYRMFSRSRSWVARMDADIKRGLSAEASVEKEQSVARNRMSKASDPYLRERLHDLDDLSNRLLRILTGQGKETGAEMPDDPILIARNIGPGELLEYGRSLKGIVLEEGSVGSHAAIVARALAIPLLIHAEKISTEALNGDRILLDGEQGLVHLRPEDTIADAFRDKMAMATDAQKKYAALRDKPAKGLCGRVIHLHMNAGLMADLPSLKSSGAEGVGLFRTELQFLVRNRVPRRGDLASLYAQVLNAAGGKRVAFRTLDIGSDKVLPYMKARDEPNPAMGWRAIRVGLEKGGVMRMQHQALIRSANGRPLTVMFPFVAQFDEFKAARERLLVEIEKEKKLGHAVPESLEIGAMLETPSMAFAPRQFFEMADFISIGGNDLKQFFFAADRENERVRKRYDTLNVSFLGLVRRIAERCAETGTHLSFCGEDAGRPVEAMCFAAIGIDNLSMRPASIGPVKHLIRRVNLQDVKEVIDEASQSGEQSVRGAVMKYLKGK